MVGAGNVNEEKESGVNEWRARCVHLLASVEDEDEDERVSLGV